MITSSKRLISSAKTIFFDFDGVIKDLVLVKSLCFEKLFNSYSLELTEKIKFHHLSHPGMSRFEKVPIYLSWAGEEVTNKNIQIYCDKFSLIAKKSVINSSWVPGILEFFNTNYNKKQFVLITATPIDEMKEILIELDIINFFDEIYGSPTSKKNALVTSIVSQNIDSKDALFIGDSESDYEAAKSVGILFLLRRTKLNYNLQKNLGLTSFKNFVDY